jgi:hypothetical protein
MKKIGIIVASIMAFATTTAQAAFNADNPKDLMCSPVFASVSVNDTIDANLSQNLLNYAVGNGEFQVWLYTDKFDVLQDASAPLHTWIGVKGDDMAVMNFVNMTYAVSDVEYKNHVRHVNTVVSSCYKR